MKVTVIIPYREDRGFLNEAIESVGRQSYKDIELILSNHPMGVSYNLNRGIEKATGELIRYLSDDDMLTPNSIADTVTYYKHANFDFTHGNAYNFSPGAMAEHIPANQNPTCQELARKNYIHGGSLVYHRRCFENFGLFDETLWTGEELEYNLRILSKGAKLGYINSFLYLYRNHPKQKSTGNKNKQHKAARVKAISEIRRKYR